MEAFLEWRVSRSVGGGDHLSERDCWSPPIVSEGVAGEL